MQKFIAMRNVERLTYMLLHEDDAGKRRTLERLLADEKAKLKALGGHPPAPRS